MNVVYWTGFSKRKNSTKVPTGAGTTKTCYLKDDTSVLNPTIKLDGHGYRNISYAQISDFGRYYYVKDVREVGPQTHVELTADPAASHKSSITGSQQFVERASTTQNAMASDGLNPPTCKVITKREQLATLANDIITYSGSDVVPSYIVGVACNEGVKYFFCTLTGNANSVEQILRLAFSQTISSQFYDMANCIVSLLKVPYTPSYVNSEIIIGDVHTGEQGRLITSDYISMSIADTLIPFASDDHLNIWSYIDFPPYTDCDIYLPFVGLVSLDASLIASSRKIGVEVRLDTRTADIVYTVRTDLNKIIGTYAGNCGAQLPIIGQTNSKLAMPTALLTAAAGVLSDNPMLAASGLVQVGMSNQKHTQINGSLSSFISSEIDNTIWVETHTKEPVSWNISNMYATQGVIVLEQRSLSGLSGFVQCKNAHVAIDGYDSERTEIESMLNNGIFIE